MSWKVLNEILGLASIDQEFCHKLLKHPVEAIKKKGFTITNEEKKVLNNIQAQDIFDFSDQLLARLPLSSSEEEDSDNLC